MNFITLRSITSLQHCEKNKTKTFETKLNQSHQLDSISMFGWKKLCLFLSFSFNYKSAPILFSLCFIISNICIRKQWRKKKKTCSIQIQIFKNKKSSNGFAIMDLFGLTYLNLSIIYWYNRL